MRRTRYISILVLVLTAVLTAAGIAWAPVPTNSAKLRAAVTVGGIMEHEREFQAIADANNNRASGTSGFDASAAHVADELREAGYNVKVQPFAFPFFEETGPSTFERLTPSARVYEREAEYEVMEYSGDGDVTGLIVPTKDAVIPPTPGSTSGCENADFPARAIRPFTSPPGPL
jgi:hypothetical protein